MLAVYGQGMYLDIYDQGILEFEYIIIKGYWDQLSLQYMIKGFCYLLCLQLIITSDIRTWCAYSL